MRAGSVLNVFFALAALAFVIFAGAYIYQNYQELEVKRAEQKAAEQNLEALRLESAARQEALAKLQSDPEYVEQTIRQKMGFAKENEVVFRFE